MAIERYALGIAFTIALLCAASMAWLLGAIVISDAADVRGVEPYFVFDIQKLMLERPLYTRPTELPFDNAWHTPLYFLIVSTLAKRLAIQPDDVYSITVLGRVVSATATVLFLLFTFLFLRFRLKIGAIASGIACCLIFVCQAPWNVVVRPDAFASLLACSALYLAVIALQEQTGRRLALLLLMAASALGMAAAFAKQNEVVVPVFLLFLLFARKDGPAFFVSALTVVAIVAIAMTPRLAGDTLFGSIEATFSLVGVGMDLQNVYEKSIVPLCMQMNMPLFFGFAFALCFAWARPGALAHKQLLALAFVTLFAAAAIASLKLGSAYNYFNDAVAIAIVCTAYGLSESDNVSTESDQPNWRIVAAVFVVSFLPAYTFQLVRQYHDPSNRIHTRLETAAYVKKALDEQPGTFLFTSDNTLATFFPDRVVVPILYTGALQKSRGHFDFAPLQRFIDQGGVSYCALGVEQTPERQLGFLGVRGDGFAFVETVDGFSIWKRIAASHETSSPASAPPSPPAPPSTALPLPSSSSFF